MADNRAARGIDLGHEDSRSRTINDLAMSIGGTISIASTENAADSSSSLS